MTGNNLYFCKQHNRTAKGRDVLHHSNHHSAAIPAFALIGSEGVSVLTVTMSCLSFAYSNMERLPGLSSRRGEYGKHDTSRTLRGGGVAADARTKA